MTITSCPPIPTEISNEGKIFNHGPHDDAPSIWFLAVGRLLRSIHTTRELHAHVETTLAAITNTRYVSGTLENLKNLINEFSVNCDRLLGIPNHGCHKAHCERCEAAEADIRQTYPPAQFAKSAIENRDDVHSYIVALRTWEFRAPNTIPEDYMDYFHYEMTEHLRVIWQLDEPRHDLCNALTSTLWSPEAAEERKELFTHIEAITFFDPGAWWIWAVQKRDPDLIDFLRRRKSERQHPAR